MKLVQDVTHLGYAHNPLSTLSVKYHVSCHSPRCETIEVVSDLSFQLSMIERMISKNLSNLLEFPFDYVPRSLFIGKGLILIWISLVEMETNSHPYEYRI